MDTTHLSFLTSKFLVKSKHFQDFRAESVAHMYVICCPAAVAPVSLVQGQLKLNGE